MWCFGTTNKKQSESAPFGVLFFIGQWRRKNGRTGRDGTARESRKAAEEKRETGAYGVGNGPGVTPANRGKRIGKINRDGIGKREKRQRGKGKIEKGELSRKKRGKAQGNRPMRTNGRGNTDGRERKQAGAGKKKSNKTGVGNRLQSEAGENCESARRNENTQNDAGGFRENAAEEEGKSGRRGREKREKDRPMLGRAKRKGKEPAGESRTER